MKYIALDVETGGIGLDKSLLTVYFAICTAELEIIDELSLQIKPKDKIYHVTAEAIEINGINIVNHDRAAKYAKDLKTTVFEFLKKYGENEKLIPVGHGVKFDIQFITECADPLISKKSWDMFCSYRVIDTASIGQFLKMKSDKYTDVSGSLGSWANYFKIDASNAHDAKADVIMSIEVLKHFLRESK